MSEWLKVIILGFVEGITEFLPISSTGHLIVATELLRFENNLDGSFELFIQLGAIIAVILYYRRDVLQQLRSVPNSRDTQRFWLAIAVASIPAGVVGILFRDEIKAILFNPLVIALALIVGGIVFFLVERNPRAEDPASDMMSITLRQALLIGLAQLTALIPGVSRSGSSILGGLFVGLNRRSAAQFSFYLAIPALGGATIIEFLDVASEITNDQLIAFLLGAVVSAVVAWIAIDWLLRYVSNNSFLIFAYYRVAAGIVILIALAAGLF